MKNLFIAAIVALTFQFTNAQRTPTPPSTTTSTSTSTVINDGNESTSVSISHTDDDYKFRARFPKNRYEKLKNLIEKELGGKNMDIGEGYSKWSNDEKVYDIKLTSRTLKISLDLNVASPELIEKFQALGEDAKIIISGTTVEAERERMQREADRMRREANRMQREAERLERQAARDAKRVERQIAQEKERIERDAERIEREAKRLDREAKRVEEMARHKGGVSSYIQRLLDDPKTKYTATSGERLNWILPELHNRLVNTLLSDKLIKSVSDVTFTSENDSMYANGQKLTEEQYDAYRSMLRAVGVQTNADFSFYKKGDHIVVIGLNTKVKKVFNDLHAKGYIASTDEPVKLLINGNSITQNGTRLSSKKVADYNAILRNNGIIPAPGKYIEMKKAGSYRLGYSIENKGLVGTWIEEE